MSTTETAKKKTVGNKTTELIVGSAAMKMGAAVTAITTAVKEIEKFDELINTKVLSVTNLEDKIGGLSQDFQNKEAQQHIDLKLSFERQKESFAQQWLSEMGLVSISGKELAQLQSDLQKATTEVDSKVAKEVAAATGAMAGKHKNETEMANLQHQLKESANTAKINALEEKCKFLEEQVKSWKDALEAEREAGVERAKSGAIGTLNLGNQSGR